MKLSISNSQSFNPHWNKDEMKDLTKALCKEIGELQYQMYAEGKHSLLIVLQGMDASGKDGLTKGLLEYCNPIGLRIKSFKKPSKEEYAHDFLWRVHKEVPAAGELTVFIRSHYEDILVPSVEGYIPAPIIEQRYDLINQFEKMLEHNHTKVLKFFLHVSPEAQEERLRERLELREKHWKHKDGDWETRKKTPQYHAVYEEIFERCGEIPWHIIPADKNWQKLYAAAEVVIKTLRSMDLQWPELTSKIFTAPDKM